MSGDKLPSGGINTAWICPEREREEGRVREVWEEGAVLFWEDVEQGRDRVGERESVMLYKHTHTHTCFADIGNNLKTFSRFHRKKKLH